MATLSSQWSNLPSDILHSLAKLLNSDIDTLRLRSVCSSWRSSLPRHPSPFSFPLQVPGILPPCGTGSGHCTLKHTPFYCLSPLADPSTGWLFRVSETSPNTFTFQHPLTTDKLDHLTTDKLDHLPRTINLLEYRISQVLDSYSLCIPEEECNSIRKVIVLRDYFSDCEFVALALGHDLGLCYWKYGDEEWTPLKGYYFEDVIVYDGICYAVDIRTRLVSLDPQFNLTEVVASLLSKDDYAQDDSFLVECESELYIVMLQVPPDDESVFGPGLAHCHAVRACKFSKFSDRWLSVDDSEDKICVLCVGSPFGVSPEDFDGFHGCPANRVYLKDGFVIDDDEFRAGAAAYTGVYHFDDCRAFGWEKAIDVSDLLLHSTLCY